MIDLSDDSRGIYIGITQNIKKRLRAHGKNKQFSYVKILKTCRNIQEAAFLNIVL